MSGDPVNGCNCPYPYPWPAPNYCWPSTGWIHITQPAPALPTPTEDRVPLTDYDVERIAKRLAELLKSEP